MAKILVIDDSPVIRRMLTRMLGAEHYYVAVASDATSAVTVAQKEKPDLIILDLSLPGGNGFLLIDRFRNLSRLAVVPIIVLSAEESEEVKAKVLRSGADAFFSKPPRPEDLLAAVGQALTRSAPTDDGNGPAG